MWGGKVIIEKVFLATGSIVQHPGSTFFRGRQCVPEPSLGVCFTVSVVHCQEPGVSSKLLISASSHSRVGVPSALQVLSFGEEREGLADSCQLSSSMTSDFFMGGFHEDS